MKEFVNMVNCHDAEVSKENLHPSFKRLLQAAKLSEAGHGAFATLARDLQVTAQTVTNWKQRGVSMDGALAAEAAYKISPTWLLGSEGTAHAAASPYTLAKPAPKLAQDTPAAYASARYECHKIIDGLPAEACERLLPVLQILAKGVERQS